MGEAQFPITEAALARLKRAWRDVPKWPLALDVAFALCRAVAVGFAGISIYGVATSELPAAALVFALPVLVVAWFGRR